MIPIQQNMDRKKDTEDMPYALGYPDRNGAAPCKKKTPIMMWSPLQIMVAAVTYMDTQTLLPVPDSATFG